MSMNPFCEIAMEEELRLREAGAASEDVTATVSPAQATDMLRTTLAMGADRAVHVLHDHDPACPLLPLAVTKILRALALQETPGLLILECSLQVKSPTAAPGDSSPRTSSSPSRSSPPPRSPRGCYVWLMD
ncbi:electron transfer flavoprotein subunit beta, mitochondrial-like [Triticum dicoccoides]|uniref:electron transfer flavoprotein subunit beta, mitochondrial-like n=1 Tax=Triticum dicoccoides TaxID=85692 RepID=UPI00189195B3|nr:electron transfer flavoprotein subunit beta, mitochondrial-like [Triticum dicoccoides]